MRENRTYGLMRGQGGAMLSPLYSTGKMAVGRWLLAVGYWLLAFGSSVAIRS
jgi:hypothetical protein